MMRWKGKRECVSIIQSQRAGVRVQSTRNKCHYLADRPPLCLDRRPNHFRRSFHSLIDAVSVDFVCVYTFLCIAVDIWSAVHWHSAVRSLESKPQTVQSNTAYSSDCVRRWVSVSIWRQRSIPSSTHSIPWSLPSTPSHCG